MAFLIDYRPRWLILLIDLGICLFSLVVAYLLRFNFASIPQVEIDSFTLVFPFVLGIRGLSFLISKIYRGIIRFTSSKDAIRIFTVLSIGSGIMLVSNLVRYYFIDTKFVVPFSIIIIEYMTSVFLMISTRMIYRTIYSELKNPGREKRAVLIFGAGESGVITKRALDRDAGTKYKTIGFIDDNAKKVGQKIENINIYSFDRMAELIRRYSVAHIIVSAQQINAKRLQQIVDIALENNAKVLNVPPVNTWINGELSFKQIKRVKIEDLLERDPIELDNENIKSYIKNKTVLITGAAGSIGSEICRQVINYEPKKIILLDQSESPLYEIENELVHHISSGKAEAVVADVRNADRMENVFKTFKPQVVFHAAAYKHVPMMENNPSESILTNVLGTKITADLAVKYNTEKFVMVSTDKAVNPTSVMGASKRIAEIYTQSLNKTSNTKFITTRFGNVLGSNGSVIPIFRSQIERGGPVTITHPEITRYFMTIAEACQLVLEAGAMGKGGEIYVFDMGQAVKIIDLAKKMIQLSGLTLGKDIQIEFTGLRPGEKLFEELLANNENTIPTHHQKILIAKVKEYNFETISAEINSLIKLFDSQNNKAIVQKMKLLVPEYISNNSVYEQLDQLQ